MFFAEWVGMGPLSVEPPDLTGALLDTVQALIVVLRSDGTIRLFNRACEQLTGYRASEVIGRRPWDFLVAPEDRAEEERAFQTLRRDRVPSRREITWICHDGRRRTIAWSNGIAIATDCEPACIIDTGIDVTDRNLAQSEMRHAFSDVERMKDEFLGVAAHEIKTPIAIIKAYAQMLTSQQDDPVLVERAVDAICRGVDRVDALVSDLLMLSQLRLGNLALHKEPIDLVPLLQSECERARERYRGAAIVIESERSIVIEGDRARLSQVIGRLLSNACKYSVAPAHVLVNARREDGFALVSVRDRGIGIPRERQRFIFGRFYRAHAGTPHDAGGIGVGLYLAKQVIDRHGGQIGFQSREGEGSIFFIRLPLARSAG